MVPQALGSADENLAIVGDVRGEAQFVLGHDKRSSTSDPYFDLDEIDLAVGMGEADVVAGIVMRHLNRTVTEGRLGGEDDLDGAVIPVARSPWWDGHARRRAR